MKTWWIVVEKQWHKDEMYGPYYEEDIASNEMQFSVMIEGSCQEDCLDCYLEENEWIPEERRFKRQRWSTFRRSVFRGREVIVIEGEE